jgi:hypothetical protein
LSLHPSQNPSISVFIDGVFAILAVHPFWLNLSTIWTAHHKIFCSKIQKLTMTTPSDDGAGELLQKTKLKNLSDDSVK